MFARLEQFKNYFNSLSSIQKRNLIGIVVLLLALPLTIMVAQIQQDLRQRAQGLPVTPATPPAPPLGPFGKAVVLRNLVFSDNNFIGITRSSTLVLNSNFTLEFWVKMDQGQNFNNQTLFRSGNNLNLFIDTGGSGTANKVAIITSNGSTNGVLIGPELPMGVWNHVAVTFVQTASNQGIIGLHVNGNTQSSSNMPFVDQLAVWEFGESLYDGVVDELRISSNLRYALDPVYTVPYLPFEADSNSLVLLHLDDNLIDSSGNTYNGAIQRYINNGPLNFITSTVPYTLPTPTPLPPTPTSAPWFPWPFDPTPTPYVAPVIPTPTTTSLIPVPQGQCPTGSSPQCLGYTTASGKTANCYTSSGQFTGDICLYSCRSCGYITPSPSTVTNPTPTSTSSTPYSTCPAGTVREECIGYTANNINMYCWGGTGSTYLGGGYAAKCESGSTPTPAATAGACPDECYSDDLRTNVGKVNGDCNSGVISTSHACPSASYNGNTQACGGRTYTCNGYWQ